MHLDKIRTRSRDTHAEKRDRKFVKIQLSSKKCEIKLNLEGSIKITNNYLIVDGYIINTECICR